MWPYNTNGMSPSRVLPLLSTWLRALTLGFLWFGSSMTMCLLGVAGWRRRVQLPTPLRCLLPQYRETVIQFLQSTTQILGAHMLCGITCKAGVLEGLRPLSSLDLLLHTSLRSLPEQGKGEGAEPARLEQGSVCPAGWISWHAGTSAIPTARGRQGGWGRGPLFQEALCHLSYS